MLGAAGRLPADIARAVRRSADSHSAAGVARRAGGATTTRPQRATPTAPAASRHAAPSSCCACRTSSCRARRCSTSTLPSSTCASSAMTIVGMLGLFYISTFIDMSDKLFKGQTTLGMIVEFLFWSTPEFLSYIIALAVLLSALVTVGLLTKNSELIVMRACGISLYRTALPMVAFALAAQRGAVRHGRARARHREPARRSAEAPHPHRLAADLRRAQSQVDRRQQRRGLSLPVLRSAQSRAEQPVGLRVRPADARAQVAACSCSARPTIPRSRPQGEVPKWCARSGLDARIRSEDAGRAASSAFEQHRRALRGRRLFRHRGARARADELRAAAQLHHRAARRAATTCSITRSACTARSRSRSSRW